MAIRYFTCPNTPYSSYTGSFDILPELEFEYGVACVDVDEMQEGLYTRKLIILTGNCVVYTPQQWEYENDQSWKIIEQGVDEFTDEEFDLPLPVCSTEEESTSEQSKGEPEMGDIIVTDEFAVNPKVNSIGSKQTKNSPQPSFNKPKPTLLELKDLAKKAGIKGWYRMSSVELRQALSH